MQLVCEREKRTGKRIIRFLYKNAQITLRAFWVQNDTVYNSYFLLYHSNEVNNIQLSILLVYYGVESQCIFIFYGLVPRVTTRQWNQEFINICLGISAYLSALLTFSLALSFMECKLLIQGQIRAIREKNTSTHKPN